MFGGRAPEVLAADRRGLSVGIFALVAMVVVAALLYTLLEPAASGVFETSMQQASSQEAKDAIALRQQIFGSILFFALFLAGLAFVAKATLESRRPG